MRWDTTDGKRYVAVQHDIDYGPTRTSPSPPMAEAARRPAD
jgi:hypothetical protein